MEGEGREERGVQMSGEEEEEGGGGGGGGGTSVFSTATVARADDDAFTARPLPAG